MRKIEEEVELLRNLVGKYKMNREKVPLQVLRTKYRASYRRLKAEMWEAVLWIAYRPPDWMWDVAPPVMAWEMMLACFRRSLAESGAKKRLGEAMFAKRDADLAVNCANEINKDLSREWDAYLEGTSRYMSWAHSDGSMSAPKPYSPFLLGVKEHDGWRRLDDSEPAPDFGGYINAELARWQPWMPKER